MIKQTIFALLICAASLQAQATLNVPGTFSTIQSAINAASNGDTVLVQIGFYAEALNFSGKSITVRGVGGKPVITQPANGDWVVRFVSGEGAGALLENVQISGLNGGIEIRNSSPTIRDVRFDGNRPHLQGVNGLQGTALSIIAAGGNTASPEVDNCIFSNNNALAPGTSGPGSAIGAASAPSSVCEPLIRNCLMVGNQAPASQWTIYLFNNGGTFNPVISNCTMTLNFSGVANAGIFMGGGGSGTSLVENSILWGNSGQEANNHPAFVVNYSDVDGGWFGAGGNNIDADPQFDAPLPASQRPLLPSSPCVDAGDESTPYLSSQDGLFDLRVRGFSVDMGAYELDAPCATPGSGDDFEQRTTTTEDGDAFACRKRVKLGSSVQISVDSPGNGQTNLVPMLGAQVHSGNAMGGLPAFPEIHVGLSSTIVYFNGSAFPFGSIPIGGGLSFSFPVPVTAIVGNIVRLQAFGIGSSAANGFFAASDAQDIMIKD